MTAHFSFVMNFTDVKYVCYFMLLPTSQLCTLFCNGLWFKDHVSACKLSTNPTFPINYTIAVLEVLQWRSL